MSTSQPPSLAHRLGHPADARLVLINADDAGMCQAGNAGVLRAIGGILPIGYAELQALTHSSLRWVSP